MTMTKISNSIQVGVRKYLAQVEQIVVLVLMTTQVVFASIVTYTVLHVVQCHHTSGTAVNNQSFSQSINLVSGARWYDHIIPVLHQLHWLPVWKWVDFKIATLVYRSLSSMALA